MPGYSCLRGTVRSPEAVRDKRRGDSFTSCTASSCRRYRKYPRPVCSKFSIVTVCSHLLSQPSSGTNCSAFHTFTSRDEHNIHTLIVILYYQVRHISRVMEKYNDSTSPSRDVSDFENASLLNTNYQKQETQRRRNYVWLTLANLFIFTLSMLSLICAVMSQKDTSGYSAAKLMDQFGIFCECTRLRTHACQDNDH
jgi:hypothetical protein